MPRYSGSAKMAAWIRIGLWIITTALRPALEVIQRLKELVFLPRTRI